MSGKMKSTKNDDLKFFLFPFGRKLKTSEISKNVEIFYY